MILVAYLLTVLALALYSYSQIDLNLTLFQSNSFLQFQNTMIQLGYYNRPLSAQIYAALILTLFALYFLLIRQVGREKISVKYVFVLVGAVAVIGLVSYPAFSHDLFNYLFDARILTHYGQNPYSFKPLDFPADPWLRFMHWVHRTYPYGPVWLILTALPSLAGLSKFILTLLNFKILFACAYIANSILIYKIANKISPSTARLSLVLYGANPLVVTESLISPHLDSVMLTLMLGSFFLYFAGRRISALILMLLSGGIKFLTLILAPLMFWNDKTQNKIIKVSVVLLSALLVPVIAMRQFYPWYFLPIFGLACLIPKNKRLIALAISLTLGLLLSYIPYLLIGSYPNEVRQWETILIVTPVALTATAIFLLSAHMPLLREFRD